MSARRFSASQQTIVRDLLTTIRKMKAQNLHVSTDQDVFGGKGASEIVFDRGGQRYVFRCEKYGDPLDNLRAAQLCISLLHRAMEEYGVLRSEQETAREFSRFFLPFAATPDDTVLLLGDGRKDWWELLGVKQTATKPEIMDAYRSLARVHHPDTGGDPVMFKRLRAAYEQGIAQAEKRS